MIYLDNAATTWPKPFTVRQAVSTAFLRYGANPGRGGHKMSLATAEQVYHCREEAAALFHCADPTHVVFTQNCTQALNLAIQGCLKSGGRAVISDLEHNSVVRPLFALNPQNPPYDVAVTVEGDNDATVRAFESKITRSTKVLICTHASNVFGTALPIRALGQLARKYHLVFIVDGAQSAGLLPIDMEQDCIDYLCVPGHKGLYGPSGTGMLLCSHTGLPSLMEGGTGSNSADPHQPDSLPDSLEAGTLNTCGICGLLEGIRWVRKMGIEKLAAGEIRLLDELYRQLANTKNIQLYTKPPLIGKTSGVLSLNVVGHHSEETAAYLDSQGIAVRAGLHCSPLAHRKYGTLKTGAVRLSLSGFTTSADIVATCDALKKYALSS